MKHLPPLNPVFRICGSKSGKALEDAAFLIRSSLREGGRLIEPFAGSGAVALKAAPVRLLMSDAQPNIVLTHRVLEHKPRALLSSFQKLSSRFLNNPSGESFYRIRNDPPKTPVERAAWFIFIVHGAYNKLWRVNGSGVCNSPYGKEAGIRRLKTGLNREHVLNVSRFLNRSGVSVEFLDCLEAIERAQAGDVVYCDPPYVDQFASFTAARFSFKDHIKLSKALHKAWKRGAIVLFHCSFSFELAELFGGWCRVFVAPTLRRIRGCNNTEVTGEMFLVSQDPQRDLFPEAEPEDLLEGYIEWREGECKTKATKSLQEMAGSFKGKSTFAEPRPQMGLFAP